MVPVYSGHPRVVSFVPFTWYVSPLPISFFFFFLNTLKIQKEIKRKEKETRDVFTASTGWQKDSSATIGEIWRRKTRKSEITRLHCRHAKKNRCGKTDRDEEHTKEKKSNIEDW